MSMKFVPQSFIDTYTWHRKFASQHITMTSHERHVSRIISNWTICSTTCSVDNKQNIEASHYWSFVRGIYRWSLDSPHKGPVMQKAFACHDVVMNTLYIEFSLCKIETDNVIITQNISCGSYQNRFDVIILMIYLQKDTTRLQTGLTASTHLLCRHL